MTDPMDRLANDREFLLHWKECWPKLRLSLIEKQFQMPSATGLMPEDVGRRTIFLKEVIEEMDRLNSHAAEPAHQPQRKKLNMRAFSKTQTQQ